jgi:hypothetical protein
MRLQAGAPRPWLVLAINSETIPSTDTFTRYSVQIFRLRKGFRAKYVDQRSIRRAN